MQIEKKLHECDPADPDRCQASGSGGEGQCRYLSLKGMIANNMIEVRDPSLYENSTNCTKHGAALQANNTEKKRVRQYRLEIWQERVDEFCENEQVKTLRDEIGILRLLLEQTLNQCSTTSELMLYSHKIGDLVMKIEKVVRSCDRLESSMGMLMDRAGALVLAAQIVELITKYVDEPEIVDKISNGIIDSITKVTNHGQ